MTAKILMGSYGNKERTTHIPLREQDVGVQSSISPQLCPLRPGVQVHV